MKKIMALLLVLTLAFTFTACGGEITDAATPAPAEPTPTLQTYPLEVDEAYYNFAVELTDYAFSKAADDEFNNELKLTIYTFTGTVEAVGTYAWDDYGIGGWAKVTTDLGTVMINNLFPFMYKNEIAMIGEAKVKSLYSDNPDNYVFPEVGETANFLAIYTGYSDEYDAPTFLLGASKDVFLLNGLEDYDPVAAGKTSS